jgi:NAD-dependent dihydropyrimidine dehydrogenase PreA subunit
MPKEYGFWKGTPRENIPWYPAVELDRCAGCKACFEFCGHGVYAWNEQDEKPVIAEPFQCIVGCSSCRDQCAAGALSFPPLSALKPFLEEKT